VLCAACGGEAAAPPKSPAAAPAPKAAPVVETPDLSPVKAPADVFVLGRIKRPTALADSVAKWAGLPVGLRDVLPFAGKELASVIAWDAPVELVASVAPSGRRVAGAVSLGLTNVDAAVRVARQQGYELKRLAPETYAIAGTSHVTCAIAPALGPALARLVCAHKASDLELLLPYVTRGLPNEALGQKDLTIELRAEPLRQRFASEIGSARLFAGFVVRELSIDSQRFDTAVSDAVYATADELAAVVHDLDTVRLEGTLDDAKHEATLDLGVAFRDHKSWVANLVGDGTRRAQPAPESFFTQPADADEGGYSVARDPHLLDGLRRSLLELADAYLEHEKLGKPTRDRVARLVTAYLALDAASVHCEGSALVAAGARDKPGPEGPGWMLLRAATPPAGVKSVAADLAAVLSDKAFRAAVAKKLKTDDKLLPTAKTLPLRGAGIPAGTLAVVVKAPRSLGQLVGASFGWKAKETEADEPSEVALAVVPSGSETIFAYAANVKELAARLAQLQNPKGDTLAKRTELERLRRSSAMTAAFTTLAHLLKASSFGSNPNGTPVSLAALPHHGLSPIFFDWTTEPGAAPKATLKTTVSAGVFEDLPGLAPLLTLGLAR